MSLLTHEDRRVSTIMTNRSTDYFPVLDGLRGLAALFVVVLHALDPFSLHEVVPHAHLAVDFFFALSGFVIAHAYERKLAEGMRFSVFFARRAIRLYPMILFGLILGTVVYVIKIVLLHRTDLIPLVALSSVLNLFLLPSPFLANEDHGTAWPLNPPSWSLTFEVIANIAYAALLYRLRGVWFNIMVGIGAVGVLALALSEGAIIGGSQWKNLLGGLIRVLYPFTAGVLLWRITQLRSSAVRGKAYTPFILLAAAMLMPVPLNMNGWYEAAVVVALVPLIVYRGSQARADGLFRRFLLWCGAISFPLYALHYPAIKAASYLVRRLNLDNSIALPWIIAAEVATCIALSHLILKFADEPFRKWLSNVRFGANRRKTPPEQVPS